MVVGEFGSLHESLSILYLDVVFGFHNVEEKFNQRLSINYEILGVL